MWLQQLPLFWEGCLHDFEVCLWEFVPVQPQEHLGVWVLLLGD